MRKAWLSFLALLLSVSPAAGQAIQSPFRYIETTHSIGIYSGFLDARPGKLGISAEPAPLFGVRYAAQLTGPFSGEIAVGLAPSQRTAKARSGTTLTDVAQIDVLMVDARGGFIFHLTGARTWKGIAPYLMAGAGVAADLVRDDPAEEVIALDQRFEIGPAFAGIPGAGVQFFVGRRVSFRLEATDHIWRLRYPATLTTSGEKETEWLHNPSISLGASFHF